MKIEVQQATALHEIGGRFANEDFIYPIQDSQSVTTADLGPVPNIPGLYIVADGAGGEGKGEVAAQLAIAEFARYFEKYPPKGALSSGYLSAALLRVEEAFTRYQEAHPASTGMGTTLALLYLEEHGATIGWIGNSRVYHFRKGELQFKTRDHSLVNDLIEQGQIDESEALTHPQRKNVLRSLTGSESPTEIDAYFIPTKDLREDDYFLLCTDGLLEEVQEEDMKRFFGQGLGLQDIKHEMFALCQDKSTDNFSAYLVQLGEVALEPLTLVGGTAGSPLEEDTELDLVDAVEELPETEEPATVFDAIQAGGSSTIFDDLSSEADEEATPENDTPVGDPPENTEGGASSWGSLYDKFQHQQGNEEAEKEPTAFSNGAGNATEAKAQVNQAQKEEKSFDFLPIIAGVALVALVIFGVWLLLKPGTTSTDSGSYPYYVDQGKSYFQSGQYSQAILYADSAMGVTNNMDQKQQAGDLRKDASEARDEEIASLIRQGEDFEATGDYPGYWKASELYSQLLSTYPDAVDSVKVANMLAGVREKMGKISDPEAFSQLLARASHFCGQAQSAEAESYFDLAAGFVGNNAQQQELNQQIADCDNSANVPANLAENDTATPQTPSSESDEATQAESTISSVDETAVEAPASPAIATTQPENAVANTSPVSVNPTNTPTPGTPASASRIASAPTQSQQEMLKRGKKLFNKSQASLSRFEEKKAAEYLEKAGQALDEEGLYMLAYLYHKGFGLKRDDKKAASYASKAALKGSAPGHYLYASILLLNENSKDSVTAKQSLTIAASKGHKESADKLQALRNSTYARYSRSLP
ncbi:MAG: protein phosphatase 2C domain-containing protein [Bacteroidota bacterium]